MSFGSGAPVPFFPLYEQAYGIPPAGLTGGYALYILSAAAVLLFAGRLSDSLGRKSVTMFGLLFSIAGCACFAVVDGLASLLLARVLTGCAVGLSMSGIASYVIDLHRPGRLTLAATIAGAGTPFGTALGAITAGLLIEWGAAPQVPFIGIATVNALALIGLIFAVETRPPGSRAALRLEFALAVPTRIRFAFITACAGFVATWILGGMYQSLGPTITATSFYDDDRILAASVLASVVGTSVFGGPLTARFRARTATIIGLAMFVVGVGSIALAAHVHSLALFFGANFLSGLGFGATFAAGLRALLERISADERAGVISAVYLVSYVGTAIPTFFAGVLVPQLGLTAVLDLTCALIILLAVLCLVGTIWPRRERPAPNHDAN
ncbi:MFS transporter [Agrococcus baldri]|uniref:MFS transporter n=1 Tax=Agrococcus baldri TaxID=153730 RepID=A0AA87UR42_9MICO|nr:MFS transporter [Agrococcus baldri]